MSTQSKDEVSQERKVARAKRLKKVYAELRAAHPDAYYKTIMYAEGVNLRFGFSNEIAAEIEGTMVVLASELLA